MIKTSMFMIVLLAFLAREACGGQTRAQPTETPRFFSKGVLMSDTTIPGEQKKDNAQPSNAVCWPLSKNRYIWIYVITTFQGPDSVRAIAYQIRKDTPDGKLLNEAILSPASDQWDAFNNGEKYFKQQGHGKVFGVPKGAVGADGKLLPGNNVFCATWYQVPRSIDRKTGRLLMTKNADGSIKHEAHTRIASIQFKLNAAEDNIDFITPITVLSQNGFTSGESFCALGTEVTGVNQWYTPYVPYNETCTQWVDVRHFYPRGIAAAMMEFNSKTGLYEWVRTGSMTKLDRGALIECFINQLGAEWIVGARAFTPQLGTETVWFKTRDLFGGLGEPFLTPSPGAPHANRSAYLCGDGVLRIFGGNLATSPFKWSRNPQYCWDVDPNTFALSNCKTVLSTDDIGVTASNSVKFRTFLSPVFQNKQIVTITVSKEITGKPTADELEKFGVHYWYVTYDRETREPWRFAP
ncbi:MAG: hypothetical protein HY736_27260 [Verrucomicrobia bacterium]|nr:hypothetical protein [Verrucomicrobiota bacterium]